MSLTPYLPPALGAQKPASKLREPRREQSTRQRLHSGCQRPTNPPHGSPSPCRLQVGKEGGLTLHWVHRFGPHLGLDILISDVKQGQLRTPHACCLVPENKTSEAAEFSHQPSPIKQNVRGQWRERETNTPITSLIVFLGHANYVYFVHSLFPGVQCPGDKDAVLVWFFVPFLSTHVTLLLTRTRRAYGVAHPAIVFMQVHKPQLLLGWDRAATKL